MTEPVSASPELARMRASGPRRFIGLGMVLGLGAILLWIAFATPPADLGWLVFLVACGAGCLWLGTALYRATEDEIVLTETGLYDSSGIELARLDAIARIERGAFAIKPSNGFVLVLDRAGPRGWKPGLWWRLGRRVAVGGVLPGHQTKPVADIIAFRIMQRDGTAA